MRKGTSDISHQMLIDFFPTSGALFRLPDLSNPKRTCFLGPLLYAGSGAEMLGTIVQKVTLDPI